MNKANTFKLAMLTLLVNGAVACTPKQNTQSDKIEPELKQEIELLDSLAKAQDVKKMQIMHECPHVTPEIMHAIITDYKKQKKQR